MRLEAGVKPLEFTRFENINTTYNMSGRGVGMAAARARAGAYGHAHGCSLITVQLAGGALRHSNFVMTVRVAKRRGRRSRPVAAACDGPGSAARWSARRR
jgi:hypothetical protein